MFMRLIHTDSAACSTLLFLTLFSNSLSPLSASPIPKHEVRAVWVATTAGLDWPKTQDRNEQQSSLRNIVRNLQRAKFNTIFFQVRARGDAYYRSSYEPWAGNLTGSPGKDPGWDPLDFLLKEAHDAGMEVHAWFNLYKAGRPASAQEGSPLHVSILHPQWVFRSDEEIWLDPGIPEVNDYLLSVALELVREYDIDGIQFDFVRYPSRDVPDMHTYRRYGRGYALDDWRRANVTAFVREFYDRATTIRPMLKVGATPVGNFIGGKPSAYTELYQDAVGWLRRGKLDYLAPQIYWNLGSSAGDPDFAELAELWQENSSGRHIYAGIGSYKPDVLAELPLEIDAARFSGCAGHAFFRYESIDEFAHLAGRYRTIAVVPAMPWKDGLSPEAPKHLAVTAIAPSANQIEWTPSPPAVDGDDARRYLVYRFRTPLFIGHDPSALIHITRSIETVYVDSATSASAGASYYAVSALDDGNNESAPSPLARVVPTELLALRSRIKPQVALAAHPSTGSSLLVAYSVPERMLVSLELCDGGGGTSLQTLVQAMREAGDHLVSIDGLDLDPGSYALKLVTGNSVVVKIVSFGPR